MGRNQEGSLGSGGNPAPRCKHASNRIFYNMSGKKAIIKITNPSFQQLTQLTKRNFFVKHFLEIARQISGKVRGRKAGGPTE
jgi:hypothetical protein